jgi:hypothetical protein
MKAGGYSLEASDQRLSEECDRPDQDGGNKNGKEEGCKSVSAAELLLWLAGCGVTGDSDRQSQSDYDDEGSQNKEARGDKQDDKAKVNEKL